MTSAHRTSRKGFTLIELLLVIAILGILAAIILVAVDPAKRLKQARNARRFSEVNGILNAILNYTVDHRGTLPSAISSATTARMIGTAADCALSGIASCDVGEDISSICANLTADLTGTNNEYLAEIPVDPRGANEYSGFIYSATGTGYYIKKTSGGRVTVGACNPEDEGSGTTTIQVKR